jgi:hypothetical protein
MPATSTIITPELLKSEPFIWDVEKQTPPPDRRVCIDATRPALWGNVTLAASAALRCGSQVSITATGHELGAFALAIPESTFIVDATEAGENSVCCLLEMPSTAPSQRAVIVAESSATLPDSSIGITSQSLEDIFTKSTFAGGWPQLKVLLADGSSFAPETRSAKDGPQPFVTGSEFVLAGIASAMLSRGLSESAAAVWGLYLFHLTIEAAAKDLGSDGVRASDLIARLPGSLRYATRYADASASVRSGLRPA